MEENALAVTESFFISFEICGGLRKNLQTVKTILLSSESPYPRRALSIQSYTAKAKFVNLLYLLPQKDGRRMPCPF